MACMAKPSWQTLLAYERQLRRTECGSDLHLWLAFRVLALPRIVDDDYARMFVVCEPPPYVPNDDRSFCIVDGEDNDMILEYRHPHRDTFKVFLARGSMYDNVVDLADIICDALQNRRDFNFGDCIANQVAMISKHDRERLAQDVWGTDVPISDCASLVRRMWWDAALGTTADVRRIAGLTGCAHFLQALVGRSIHFRDAQQTTRKPTIWVLVGLPGSGKSHWVDAQIGMGLPDRTVISVDRIIDEWAQQRGQTYA